MTLDWGKKDELVQAAFRKGHSVHGRRFYEVSLHNFIAFLEEKSIGEVNGENVHSVLNSFVEWNDARGIRSKTIIDCLSETKRFLRCQDIGIHEVQRHI